MISLPGAKFSLKDWLVKFDDHFKQIYGERWAGLRASLEREVRGKVLLENPFALQDYSLDEASLFPARCMEVAEGDLVGDFCSAPGGKLLSMIFSVRGKARFVACDLSPARVSRLKAILHDCVPPELLSNIEVRKADSALWGKRRPGEFDRVLVDAPCSGEAHLLASPKELERWSAKGSKRLAIRQHSLLCSALDSVRMGGRVVYSTCSISPIENDGVIERLHESREGQFKVEKINHNKGEPTSHGWIILPDKDGCGPIYTSVLERTDR